MQFKRQLHTQTRWTMRQAPEFTNKKCSQFPEGFFLPYISTYFQLLSTMRERTHAHAHEDTHTLLADDDASKGWRTFISPSIYLCVWVYFISSFVHWFKLKSCENSTIIFSGIYVQLSFTSLNCGRKSHGFSEVCRSFRKWRIRYLFVKLTKASIFIWITSSFHWLISLYSILNDLFAQKKKATTS